MASQFQLTPEELAERLPSGKQTTFTNRVAWAKAHLKGARLVDSPRRGVYRLTDRGRAVLAENPASIGTAYLSRFPEYIAFRSGSSTSAPTGNTATTSGFVQPQDSRTPDDLMADGYRQIRSALVAELRERINHASGHV